MARKRIIAETRSLPNVKIRLYDVGHIPGTLNVILKGRMNKPSSILYVLPLPPETEASEWRPPRSLGPGSNTHVHWSVLVTLMSVAPA